MRKVFLLAVCVAFTTTAFVSCGSDDNFTKEVKKPDPVQPSPDPEDPNKGKQDLVKGEVKEGYSGFFTAEEKKQDLRFVRVLYAAEGSEKEGQSNSVKQLVFDSTDPQGKAVKVYRFQIVVKNTGYDKLQTDINAPGADYKLKKLTEGAKLFIEVPVEGGKMLLDKAYVGNLGYSTKDSGGERHQLAVDEVSDLRLRVTKLKLPEFGSSAKPGDQGIKYNEGEISLEFLCKAKYQSVDKTGDFSVKINSKISVTHIRGAERADRAVAINPEIVSKNIQE